MEIIRNVDWLEVELKAGRAIIGERIHLTRPADYTGSGSITGCVITTDFEENPFLWMNEPEAA